MDELMKIIPWDKLSEVGIVSVISIIVIYFVFKKYIDHKTHELSIHMQKMKQKNEIELQKVKQEVAQIKKNIVKDSDIHIPKGTQMEDNEITGSTIKVD